MSLKTCDILWVFMLICSSYWRTRHFAPCYALSVEKITSAIATLWLCFQDVRQRFIISRKRLKVFILKTSSERVSVCVQSCGIVPAEKAAASTPRRWAAAAPSTRLWDLCRSVSFALGGRLCRRIEAMRWAGWSKDREDSFHPSQC